MQSVVVHENDVLLVAGDALLSCCMQGFGPDGLGVITVSGVPGFEERREALLPLANSFANLPAAAKHACENEDSQYNVGWSHGKESLRNGIKDIHKGSFYANPVQDTYDVDDASARRYSTYYTPNIWPQQDLPQLEPAFKALGSLIITVGVKLAAHCSRWVAKAWAVAMACKRRRHAPECTRSPSNSCRSPASKNLPQ